MIYDAVFVPSSPRGGVIVMYNIICKVFALRGNMYVLFYLLVVRDVINSGTGGGERNYHGLLGKTGERLVVIPGVLLRRNPTSLSNKTVQQHRTHRNNYYIVQRSNSSKKIRSSSLEAGGERFPNPRKKGIHGGRMLLPTGC